MIELRALVLFLLLAFCESGLAEESMDQSSVSGGGEQDLVLVESLLQEGNPCEAKKLLLKLDDSNIKVMHARGILAYRGYCREPDYSEAYALFQRAAAGGNLDSYYYKGLMLYAGRGVEQNLVEAGRVFLWLAAFDHDKTKKLVKKLSDSGYLDGEEFNSLLEERAELVRIFKEENEVDFLDRRYFESFLDNYDTERLKDLKSLTAPEK